MANTEELNQDFGVTDPNQDIDVAPTYDDISSEANAKNLSSYQAWLTTSQLKLPVEEYDLLYSKAKKDKLGERAKLSIEQSERFRMGLSTLLEQTTSEDFKEMSEDLPELHRQVEAENNSDKSWAFAVARHQALPDTPEDLIKQSAFRIYVAAKQNDIMEKFHSDTADVVANWGGAILGIDFNWDMEQFRQETGYTPEDYFAAIRNSPIDEKIGMVDALIPILVDTQDENAIKIVRSLQNALEVSGDEVKFDRIVDAVGIAFAAADVALIIRSVAKHANRGNTMSAAIDAERAGRVAGAALSDVEMARRIGVAPEDAAVTATPFRNEEILSRARDGAHNQTMREVTGRIQDSTNDMRSILGKALDREFALTPDLGKVTVPRSESEAIDVYREGLVREYANTPMEFGETRVVRNINGQLSIETIVNRITEEARRIIETQTARAGDQPLGTSIRQVEATKGLGSDFGKTRLVPEREELIAQAGNKLSRGDRKQLKFELKDLQKKLADTKKSEPSKPTPTTTKGKAARKAKQEAVKQAGREDIEAVALLEDRLARVTAQLDADRLASEAEATLTRLDQGVIQETVGTSIPIQGPSRPGKITKTPIQGPLRPIIDRTVEEIVGPGRPVNMAFTRRETIDLGTSEVGVPVDALPNRGLISRLIASPKLKFTNGEGRSILNVVENAEIAESTTARFDDMFRESYEYALSDMPGRFRNKKAWEDLEYLLQFGDEVGDSGVRYTPAQLMDEGVVTPAGRITFDERQATAYYRLLEISDFSYAAENMMARKVKDSQGFKTVRFGDDSTGEGLPVNSHQALTLLKGDFPENAQVLNKAQGGFVRLRDINFKTIDERQQVLVRMGDDIPVIKKDAEEDPSSFFDLVLVNRSQLEELPTSILGARDAYIPKINQNVRFVIKEHISGTKNGIQLKASREAGEDGVRSYAHSMTDSVTDAEAIIARLEAENPGKVYKIHDDLDARLTGKVDTSGSRGAQFSGARSTRDIRYGLEQTSVDRLPAFEAIQRNLQHISNKLPRNEWRMSIVERLEEAVRAGNKPELKNWKYGDPIPQHEKSLIDLKEYIDTQLKIPTKEETAWEGATRRISEWMEGTGPFDRELNIPLKKKPLNLRRSVLHLGQQDPISAMRASAFHSLLGWFNPSQILVQAMGSSIAIGLHPVHAEKAIRIFPLARSMMFNEDVATRTFWAKKLGVNETEFTKMMAQFDRTGLKNSIKSTADHNAATNNFGMVSSGIRKAADKGLMFYRNGEEFSRFVGWHIARDKWIAANPGKTVFSEIAERAIFAESQNLTLNMSKANASAWQSGVLSIPTQFFQVQAKFVEATLSGARGLTVGSRVKMLVGQTALFGSAGVPFAGPYIANQLAGLTGQNPEDITEEQIDLYRGGIVQWITGGELALAKRGAIGSGIEDFWGSLFREDVSTAEKLFGAFGETFKRSANAIQGFAPLFMSRELTYQDAAVMASNVGEIVSTFNNAEKAYFMWTTQKYIDSAGRTVASGFNNVEIAGQAFGFTPDKVELIGELLKNKRKRADYRSKVAKQITRQMSKHLLLFPNDPDTAKNVNGMLVQHMLASLPYDDRQSVLNTVRGVIKNAGGTREEKIMQEHFLNMNSSVTSDILDAAVIHSITPNKERD